MESFSRIYPNLVQVFNRRRAGEIERLSIADFKTYQTIDQNTDCDIFNSLTEESKKTAKQYYRCEIRGKLARNVPVLFHLNHLTAIELLIQYRVDVGISANNPYVFAIPGGDNTFLRACNLLRKFSELCGAKRPSFRLIIKRNTAAQTYCYPISFIGFTRK